MKEIVVKGSESNDVEWVYGRVVGALKLAGIEANVVLEKEKASGLGGAGAPKMYVDGRKVSLEDFEMEARLARMFEFLGNQA